MYTVFTKKALLCIFGMVLNMALQDLATLLQKRIWCRCFPVNFLKFFITPSFIERLQWVLLFITELFNWTCFLMF